jgi:hypothetical protein
MVGMESAFSVSYSVILVDFIVGSLVLNRNEWSL